MAVTRRRAPAPATTGIAPARAVAYTVVRRVFEEGAWADRALRGEAERARLDTRDRALATRLAYGVVQRKATLDWLIERLADRPADRLDAPLLASLRLGLFQLGYLERVPQHAAVGESVELAKRHARRGSGLVNAVLRRATNEAAALLAQLTDDTPEQAALMHSHPEWIARLWWDAYGAETARALMRAGNEPAESAIRINTLRARKGSVPDLSVLAHATAARKGTDPFLSEARILDQPFDVQGSPEWAAGLIMPQSRAAMLPARLLDPQPGESVLDLCAAPGGKTTHLAALMNDEGSITAVERHPGRAAQLRRTCTRMGASCVDVVIGDAAEPPIDPQARFDRVLVDPPCSDLGTLASRPDARWRKAPEDPSRLAEIQSSILEAAVGHLKPGGTLVYSTCTLSPVENEQRIAALLEKHRDLEPGALPSDLAVWEHATCAGALQTFPHRDGTDGFFVARLRRRP